jgi:hypothetical protein
VATASVFFVFLLLVFLGGVINIGRIMRARGDLQHAADSAALAAAEGLVMGQPNVLANARSTAQQFGATFRLGTNVNVNIPGTDVDFGFWHWAPGACVFSATSCPMGWEPAPEPSPSPLLGANAVHVRTRYQVPSILDYFAGTGSPTLQAEAWAVGRRARVSCAMPVAISSCQILDAQGALNCPNTNVDGDPMQRFSFTSGIENFPAQFWPSPCTGPPDFGPPCQDQPLPLDNSLALTRIDLQHVGGDDTDGIWRTFVDHHTYSNATDCAASPADFLTGMTPVPPDPRPNAEPFLWGLMGQATQNGPKDGPCLLGQKLVLPVVQPDACPGVWPAVNAGNVIGYVTVIFRSVVCTDGSWLDSTNCDAAGFEAAATNCGNQDNSHAGQTSDHLRLNAEILCEPPTGYGPGTSSERHNRALQPRLVTP